jgi:transcriptional regulator with XRE-family HTH domain
MAPGEVARRAGISAARVVQIERNERKGKVQLDTLGRLAAALDCRLVYAFVPRTSFEAMVLEQARRRAAADDVRVAGARGLGPDVVAPLDAPDLEALADELMAARRLWSPPLGTVEP